MNRRTLSFAAVALLVVATGCLGGGGVNEARLAQNATYDWDTDARATYNVTGDQYHAVFEVRNGTELGVYRLDDLGGRQSVSISALQFRYPNGSVVNASHLDVRQEGSRTVITPPADRGKIAYTGSTLPKSFKTPVLVDGSHEVVLPRNMRVGAFLLGSVSPGGYEKSVDPETDRVRVRWAETPSDTLEFQYYLQRDFYLFSGLVVALAGIAVVGVAYYRLRIRALARQRAETDLVEDS